MMDWHTVTAIAAATIILSVTSKWWLPPLLNALQGKRIEAVWRDKKYLLHVDSPEATSVAKIPTQAALLSSQISAISYRVAVINQSTVVTDAEAAAAVQALQIQVHRDFAPAWGVDADLTFVPAGDHLPAGWWSLVINDESDNPNVVGALTYRDLTKENLPCAKVFAGAALRANFPWTLVASHALLEMLANPKLNRTVFVEFAKNQRRVFPLEVCNACESADCAYKINGVLVSDFVFPEWFEPSRKGGQNQFDYRKLMSEPFKILPGGYMPVLDITSGDWQLLFGDRSAAVRTASRRRTASKKKAA